MSINTAGAIAGMYKDSSSQYHGFVRAAKGTITTFDAPGAGTGYAVGTAPSASTRRGLSLDTTLTRAMCITVSYVLPTAR